MEGNSRKSQEVHAHERSWRDRSRPAIGARVIDVRDFIARNVKPYSGDEKFLTGPSERTKAVWAKLQPYFQEERKKGVLAVDVHTPSTHAGAQGRLYRQGQ